MVRSLWVSIKQPFRQQKTVGVEFPAWENHFFGGPQKTLTLLLTPYIISHINAMSMGLLARVDNMKDKDIPKMVEELGNTSDLMRKQFASNDLMRKQFASKVDVTFSPVNRWEMDETHSCSWQ